MNNQACEVIHLSTWSLESELQIVSGSGSNRSKANHQSEWKNHRKWNAMFCAKGASDNQWTWYNGFHLELDEESGIVHAVACISWSQSFWTQIEALSPLLSDPAPRAWRIYSTRMHFTLHSFGSNFVLESQWLQNEAFANDDCANEKAPSRTSRPDLIKTSTLFFFNWFLSCGWSSFYFQHNIRVIWRNGNIWKFICWMRR